MRTNDNIIDPGVLLEEFEAYLHAHHRSPSTIRLYLSNLKPFFKYIKRNGIINPVTTSWRRIESYQTSLLSSKKYKGSTIEVRMKSVKRFYEFMCRQAIIKRNPCLFIDPPKLEKSLPKKILSIREVNNLLAQPNTHTDIGIRDKAILETFYSTGMRLSELCNLKVFDINTEEELVRIEKGKGKKDRIVPIGKEALQWIEEYQKHTRGYFMRHQKKHYDLFLGVLGKKIAIGTVQRFIKFYGKQAHINKPITPHIMRHTCATHLLSNGADIVYVQKLLGHKKLDTSEKYLRVLYDDLVKMQQNHHPRERHAHAI